MRPLLLLFICLMGISIDVRAQDLPTSVVYQRGNYGYACFRIPALLRAADNSLLAFAEARVNGTSDHGNIDLVVRRSTDNGNTWGDMTVVWSDSGNTCGNATPVLIPQTGRIILLACWNRGDDIEADIESGQSQDTRRVFSMYSDDHGQTWSVPQEITESVKQPDWTWYATGPCHAIRKLKSPHKGRLIIPANHKYRDESGRIISRSHLLYSDDDGLTWKIGAISQVGGNESSIVELPNGNLMLNMRHTDSEDLYRLCALSRDGGETWIYTWEETQLIEPRCQGVLLNYKDRKGRLTRNILFSNPRSLRRENLSIGISQDNGYSWPRFITVWKGRAAYSDMVNLPDGAIGVLFENGIAGGKENLYYRISFTIVPASRLFDITRKP